MENSVDRVPNVGAVERGASVMAGSLLVFAGLKRRDWAGLGIAAAGAALIGRGLTGHCAAYEAAGIATTGHEGDSVSVPYRDGIRVDKTITVNKPRFEVYSYWRDFENLPTFMHHLERVRHTSDKVSHWVAKAPLGRSVEWDAEVINDVPGELVAWRSLPGADVRNAGSVHFRDAAGNRGTELKVELQYVPPGGQVGAFFAKLLGENPGQQVEEDLRRFKMMLETGEVPKNLHEHHKSEEVRNKQRDKERDVQLASQESFPASDAPAWT